MSDDNALEEVVAAALGVTQTTDTPAQKREFRTVGVGYANTHATVDSALVEAVGPLPYIVSWNRSKAGKLTAQYRVVGPWTDLPDTLERTIYERSDPAPDMPVNDVRTSDGVWYHRSGLTGWRGRWDEWDRDWSSLPFPLTYIHPHTAKPEEPTS